MSVYEKQYELLFQEAKSRYGQLQNIPIDLLFGDGWFFTMRAGVKIFSIFYKKRNYFIKVNLRKETILSKLSQDDIIAWFGHELAHVIDYEIMSNGNLILFLFKYIFNLKFRFSVEKRTNAFACNNGFSRELFGLWEKFISMKLINKRYQDYILKNYCPDWNDIKTLAEKHDITREIYENLKNSAISQKS